MKRTLITQTHTRNNNLHFSRSTTAGVNLHLSFLTLEIIIVRGSISYASIHGQLEEEDHDMCYRRFVVVVAAAAGVVLHVCVSAAYRILHVIKNVFLSHEKNRLCCATFLPIATKTGGLTRIFLLTIVCP
ncbi:hypothetical protein ACJX0J_024730 [Zea mays]